jgi:type IX secretion system PorP/SprF family membrane protein
MKSIKYIILSLTATLSSSALLAQDVHFSQFQMAPVTSNPAQTGAFEGTFRIGGIYREQWASVIKANKYVTPSAYIDAPIVRGFGKNDWVGAGVAIISDQSGNAVYQNTTALLSAAYHLGLGAKGNSTLSLGVQGGIVQKKFDQTKLLGEKDIQGGTTGGQNDVLAGGLPSTSYPDFNVGALFNHTVSSKINFNVGAAMAHFTSPRETFTNGGAQNLPARISAQAGANIDLNDKMTLMPALMFQTQSKAAELNVQTHLGYHLNAAKDVTILGGLGYRATKADALFPMVGVWYKGLRAGLAYDVNLGGLNAYTQGNGGFELGVSYIARISKLPVVKPILFCPRF